MLEVKIFTLYPDLFPGPLNVGITKKLRKIKFGILESLTLETIQRMVEDLLMTHHLEEVVECY